VGTILLSACVEFMTRKLNPSKEDCSVPCKKVDLPMLGMRMVHYSKPLFKYMNTQSIWNREKIRRNCTHSSLCRTNAFEPIRRYKFNFEQIIITCRWFLLVITACGFPIKALESRFIVQRGGDLVCAVTLWIHAPSILILIRLISLRLCIPFLPGIGHSDLTLPPS
jgi:hypothetical protein